MQYEEIDSISRSDAMVALGSANSKDIVYLRQNGVGHDKTCADAILPKVHILSVLSLLLSHSLLLPHGIEN